MGNPYKGLAAIAAERIRQQDKTETQSLHDEGLMTELKLQQNLYDLAASDDATIIRYFKGHENEH